MIHKGPRLAVRATKVQGNVTTVLPGHTREYRRIPQCRRPIADDQSLHQALAGPTVYMRLSRARPAGGAAIVDALRPSRHSAYRRPSGRIRDVL